jgi:catechol 2,3-dioxygenase-like lactoylglutathione lyase family enzyme
MPKGELQQIHPVLPVRSVTASLHYYVEKLGFTIAFVDDSVTPDYAGVRRDHIEIHLQTHSAEEWGVMTASSLRFVVTQIEDLYSEFKKMSVFHSNTALKETAWGTKEFAFFDPDMNGLSFYKDI